MRIYDEAQRIILGQAPVEQMRSVCQQIQERNLRLRIADCGLGSAELGTSAFGNLNEVEDEQG